MAGAEIEILLTKAVIDRRVRELAGEISQDYAGREILIVGVLKGAFIFMADLIRGLSVPCSVDFVRLVSYHDGSVSSGDVRITKDLETPIAGRDVLIVEDIVDTGITLSRLVEVLRERKPASLKYAPFLTKGQGGGFLSLPTMWGSPFPTVLWLDMVLIIMKNTVFFPMSAC